MALAGGGAEVSPEIFALSAAGMSSNLRGDDGVRHQPQKGARQRLVLAEHHRVRTAGTVTRSEESLPLSAQSMDTGIETSESKTALFVGLNFRERGPGGRQRAQRPRVGKAQGHRRPWDGSVGRQVHHPVYTLPQIGSNGVNQDSRFGVPSDHT